MTVARALNSGVRRWLANKLAGLARRIYPPSEEVLSFYADRMIDMVIHGHSTVKVTAVKPEELFIDNDGSTWTFTANGGWVKK